MTSYMGSNQGKVPPKKGVGRPKDREVKEKRRRLKSGKEGCSQRRSSLKEDRN